MEETVGSLEQIAGSLADPQKEKIIQVIVESKTKQAVNNNLMKLYPNETVHVIYKRIQPLIKNLPGR